MADKDYTLDKAVSWDMSLDDIEDLPGFSVYPSGSYTIEIPSTPERRDINGHDAAQIDMKLLEVHEVSDKLDDDETEPKAGDVCSLSFMLDNKVGADSFKKFLKPFGLKLETSNIGEIIGQIKGMTALVIIKRTYNKDKDRHYVKVKKLAVV